VRCVVWQSVSMRSSRPRKARWKVAEHRFRPKARADIPDQVRAWTPPSVPRGRRARPG